MKDKESPFACDMTAIGLDQRGAHLATIEKLFRYVKTIRELPNGYSFQLVNESDVLRLAVEFITLERLRCPFFGFGIEVESEGGAIRVESFHEDRKSMANPDRKVIRINPNLPVEKFSLFDYIQIEEAQLPEATQEKRIMIVHTQNVDRSTAH